jgi:hypothetical protein
MLELLTFIVVSAIAMTFFSDIMSRAVKTVAKRRSSRGVIHVADAEQSAV